MICYESIQTHAKKISHSLQKAVSVGKLALASIATHGTRHRNKVRGLFFSLKCGYMKEK